MNPKLQPLNPKAQTLNILKPLPLNPDLMMQPNPQPGKSLNPQSLSTCSTNPKWEFPKIGVLLFRVLYWGPLFSETPKSLSQTCCMWPKGGANSDPTQKPKAPNLVARIQAPLSIQGFLGFRSPTEFAKARFWVFLGVWGSVGFLSSSWHSISLNYGLNPEMCGRWTFRQAKFGTQGQLKLMGLDTQTADWGHAASVCEQLQHQNIPIWPHMYIFMCIWVVRQIDRQKN